jgi:hypothetical protein
MFYNSGVLCGACKRTAVTEYIAKVNPAGPKPDPPALYP